MRVSADKAKALPALDFNSDLILPRSPLLSSGRLLELQIVHAR